MSENNKFQLNQIFIRLIEQSGFNQSIEIIKKTRYGYASKQKIYEVNYRPTKKLSPIQNGQFLKFQDLKKQFLNQEQLSKYQISIIEKFNFKISYDIGDQIIPLEGLEFINLDGQQIDVIDRNYKHDNNFVALINFWASWNGSSLALMSQNQKLLKKNQDLWQGRVKIVGISLDKDQDQLFKKIIDMNLDEIEHYRNKKGWDHSDKGLKFYNLPGIPFITLTDKMGKIQYIGQPDKCNIEDEINKILSDTTLQQNIKLCQEQNTVTDLIVDKIMFTKYKNFLHEVWSQNLIEFDNATEHLDLILEKSYQFSLDGFKSRQLYGKLNLSFFADIKNKEIIMKRIDLIKQQFSDDQIVKIQTIINDPLENIQNHLKFIYDQIDRYSLPLTINKKKIKYFNYQNGLIQQESILYYVQSEQLNPQFAPMLKTVNKILENYLDQNQDRNMDEFQYLLSTGIKSHVRVGQSFYQIDKFHRYKNTDDVTIVAKDGEVLVLIFWEFWCKKCLEVLLKIRNLMSTKFEWSDGIRFIGISLESELDTEKWIESQQDLFRNIQLLFMKDGKDSNISMNIYGVNSVPYFVIIDKYGIVQHLGNYNNLESIIDNLINQTQKINKKPQNSIISIQQAQAIEDFLNDKLQFSELDQKMLDVPENCFKFSVEIHERFQNHQRLGFNENPDFIESVILKYWIRDQNLNLFQNTLDQIYKIIPKEFITQDIEISKVVNIPFPGNICNYCKFQLNDSVPQYYSYFGNSHYCIQCAESYDNQKIGLNKYKITDSLVFINAPVLDKTVSRDIDEFRLGKNLKLNPDQKGSQQHDMCCNGCNSQGEQGPRFIALNCIQGQLSQDGYFDLCYKCFIIWRNRQEQCYKLIEKYSNEKLNTDTLFLRILFNQGYYNF